MESVEMGTMEMKKKSMKMESVEMEAEPVKMGGENNSDTTETLEIEAMGMEPDEMAEGKLSDATGTETTEIVEKENSDKAESVETEPVDSDGKKRLGPKQIKLLCLVGGAVCAVALCLILGTAMQNPASGASIDDPDPSNDSPEASYEDNDLFASALSSGEFSSTVLEETEDAGVDYVLDTLFIGDSNTAGMINYSSITNVSMNNGIGIVSMGISHVISLRCVKFRGMEAITVPEAVKILQPRRIVINFGTNDYYMSPEKYAENYNKALDAIQAAYPYSDIIIASIFPITANCSYYTVTMPIVEKFNLELVKLAQERGLKFLNWSEVLKDPATGFCKPEYMAGDGVHLSKSGMEQIANYFRTHSLDSEDKRPKPLQPIPAREPTPPGLLGSGPRTPVEEPPPVETSEPATEQILVTVTFVSGGGGSLSGTTSFTVGPGATVSVSPVPDSGYVLVGPTSFTVPANATQGQSFTVTVAFAPDAGNSGDPGTTGGGDDTTGGGNTTGGGGDTTEGGDDTTEGGDDTTVGGDDPGGGDDSGGGDSP